MAFGLGFILGPFIGGQLARIAVPVPVWVATAFALVNLAVVLLLLPETHPVEARSTLPRRRDLNPLSRIGKVLINPSVGQLCAAFFLFFLAFNGFTAILVLYFKQRFGWGPELATVAFLVVGGRDGGPRRADRSTGETLRRMAPTLAAWDSSLPAAC